MESKNRIEIKKYSEKVQMEQVARNAAASEVTRLTEDISSLKLEAEKDLQVLRDEIAELETENSKLRE